MTAGLLEIERGIMKIEDVLSLSRMIYEAKGNNVAVLDVKYVAGFTDYFIIATVNSAAHANGLREKIVDFLSERGIKLEEGKRRQTEGKDWNLIDLGDVVVHLMSEEAREFYDLEGLWHRANVLHTDFDKA